MYVNLSEKKKQNKNKIADNQKSMYFDMCHISLVKKKSIPSRNSVKTKNEFVWFQYFYLFYNLINEHVLNISDYEILG